MSVVQEGPHNPRSVQCQPLPWTLPRLQVFISAAQGVSLELYPGQTTVYLQDRCGCVWHHASQVGANFPGHHPRLGNEHEGAEPPAGALPLHASSPKTHKCLGTRGHCPEYDKHALSSVGPLPLKSIKAPLVSKQEAAGLPGIHRASPPTQEAGAPPLLCVPSQ